jgi:hypothetical protein
MQTYNHPDDTVLDVEYLVKFSMPGRTALGASNGKPAFGYAMSTLCARTGAHDSLIQQLKAIDIIGRCYGYTVELNLIFLDLASDQCTTNRFGRKQLFVACKSPLFDADTILMQSVDRLSRMPDELTVLKMELRKLGKIIHCSTSQPALSVAETEHYLNQPYRTGYPR